jgi:S1-C subfamily serine protease
VRVLAGDRRTLIAAVALSACVGLAGGALGAWAIYSRFGPAERVVTQLVTTNGKGSGATLTVTAIAQQKASGVVQVITQPQTVTNLGPGASGFANGCLVSSDGLVITTIHAVHGATNLRVSTADGHAYPAIIVRTDTTHGVALLRAVGAQGLTPLSLASDVPRAGDLVLSVAHPPFSSLAVSTGTVSSTGGTITLADGEPPLESVIEVDGTPDPRDDGAPLLNGAGDVVGVVVSAGAASPGIVAFSGRAAAQLVTRVIAGAQSQPTVGADSMILDPATAASADTPPGALIVSVVAAGPAAVAGLAAHDVVTSVDGTPVDATHPFDALALGLDPEQQVTLVVWRAGRTISLTLTVGTA